MSFLAPSLSHIQNTLSYSKALFPRLAESLESIFGGKSEEVVSLALIFSKLGYAGPRIDPTKRATYRFNRLYAFDLALEYKEALKKILNLTDLGFYYFCEVMLFQGNVSQKINWQEPLSKLIDETGDLLQDRTPLRRQQNRFSNPLTAMVTLATRLDVSHHRLQWWQKNTVFIDLINKLGHDLRILDIYLEKSRLELEWAKGISEDLATTNDAINTQLSALNEKYQTVIDTFLEEQLGPDSPTRVQYMHLLREQGFSSRSASEVLAKIQNGLSHASVRSYLWFTASFGIPNIEVKDDARKIVIQVDHDLPFHSPIYYLDHVRNFHTRRIRSALGQIQQALNIEITLEEIEFRARPALYKKIAAAPKADVHSHLNMSYPFDSFVWKEIFLKIPTEDPDAYAAVLTTIQDRLNNLVRKKYPSPEMSQIDLLSLVDQLNRLLDDVLEFLEQRSSYRDKSGDREGIINQAEILISNLEHTPLESQEKRSLDIIKLKIDLFYRLKSYIFSLFTFGEGSLDEFISTMDLTRDVPSALFSGYHATERKVLTSLRDYKAENVSRIELRTTSYDLDKTFTQILAQICGFRDAINGNGSNTDFGIIAVLRKADDKDAPLADRQENRSRFVKSVLERLRTLDRNYLATLADAAGLNINTITEQDILQHFVGFDAADREEQSPPEVFFKAYHAVVDYNHEMVEQRMPERQLGLTYHVGESTEDVSIESGLRHMFEAIYMAPIQENFFLNPPPAVLHRLGQGILAGIDFDLLLGQTKVEPASESLKQLRFDLALLKAGIPLVSVTEESLKQKIGSLENQLAINPNAPCQIVYDQDLILDLKTRAAFLRDILIENNIVVETNPTSNLIVSPYIPTLAFHPMKVFLEYHYMDWFNDGFNATSKTFYNRPLTNKTVDDFKKLISRQSAKKATLARTQVNAIVCTDDKTVLGTTVSREIYRIIRALNYPDAAALTLIERGLNASFSVLLRKTAPAEDMSYLKKAWQFESRLHLNPDNPSSREKASRRKAPTIMNMETLLACLQKGSPLPQGPLVIDASEDFLRALSSEGLKRLINEETAWKLSTYGEALIKLLMYPFYKKYFIKETDPFYQPVASVRNAMYIDQALGLYGGDGGASYVNPENSISSPVRALEEATRYASFDDASKTYILALQKIMANFRALRIFNLERLQKQHPKSIYVPLLSLAETWTFWVYSSTETSVPSLFNTGNNNWATDASKKPEKRDLAKAHITFIEEMIAREETAFNDFKKSAISEAEIHFLELARQWKSTATGSEINPFSEFSDLISSNPDHPAVRQYLKLTYYRKYILPRYATNPEGLIDTINKVTGKVEAGIKEQVFLDLGMRDGWPREFEPDLFILGDFYTASIHLDASEEALLNHLASSADMIHSLFKRAPRVVLMRHEDGSSFISPSHPERLSSEVQAMSLVAALLVLGNSDQKSAFANKILHFFQTRKTQTTSLLPLKAA